MTQITEKGKRSLLRECRYLIEETIGNENELVSRVRVLAKEFYVSMANTNMEQAAAKLVEAFELLRNTPVDANNAPHFRKAMYLLDTSFFIYAFANGDEELRKIGWNIWDNRMYFQGGLYDAIVGARFYLTLVRAGVKHEVAIEEAVSQAQNPKLKELLEHYANETQGGGSTGGNSQGA